MELTKEYFDSQIGMIYNRFDHVINTNHFSQKMGTVVTKQQLEIAINEAIEQITAFRQSLHEELLQVISHGFLDILTRLDLSKRIGKLENEVEDLQQSLNPEV